MCSCLFPSRHVCSIPAKGRVCTPKVAKVQSCCTSTTLIPAKDVIFAGWISSHRTALKDELDLRVRTSCKSASSLVQWAARSLLQLAACVLLCKLAARVPSCNLRRLLLFCSLRALVFAALPILCAAWPRFRQGRNPDFAGSVAFVGKHAKHLEKLYE